jgi:hypothetical protein
MRAVVSFLGLAMGLFILGSSQASAQATRTWVSGVGDDANPCSRTAPCKTFAGAISKTAPAGEINVLDPGGFGAVTITKSITIRSDHIEAGVLVSGTNGIVISAAPTDTIVLEGLDFDGIGAGLNGVNILTGKTVYIVRCAIRRFTQNGVNLADSTVNAEVVIKDSLINLNGGGVSVQQSNPAIFNSALILNTAVDDNTNFGVQANGAGALVALSNSEISGAGPAISVLNSGSALSFGGTNLVNGLGSFTSTVPFK